MAPVPVSAAHLPTTGKETSTQASADGILLPCWVGLKIEKERPRKPAQALCLSVLSTAGSHIEGTSQPAAGRHPLSVSTNLGLVPSDVLSINRMGWDFLAVQW